MLSYEANTHRIKKATTATETYIEGSKITDLRNEQRDQLLQILVRWVELHLFVVESKFHLQGRKFFVVFADFESFYPRPNCPHQ